MEDRLIGLAVFLTVCLIATAGTHAQEARASPRSSKPNATGNDTSAAAKLKEQTQTTTCGDLNDLSRRIEICAKPMMDMVQGTMEKWPRNEDDAMELCESFAGAEKCIRDASRKCAKGLHKSILAALALSIGRSRKRECGRAKAAGIVKTTTCLENHQDSVKNWMSNVTGRLSAIELQEKSLDKKINGVCCMIRDIEIELKAILDPFCPVESAFINRLYKSVLEDVIDLVCRNPKCNNYLKNYKVTKSQNLDGIISIILRIVFALDNP